MWINESYQFSLDLFISFILLIIYTFWLFTICPAHPFVRGYGQLLRLIYMKIYMNDILFNIIYVS